MNGKMTNRQLNALETKDTIFHTFNKFDEAYAEAYEKVKQIPVWITGGVLAE